MFYNKAFCLKLNLPLNHVFFPSFGHKKIFVGQGSHAKNIKNTRTFNLDSKD